MIPAGLYRIALALILGCTFLSGCRSPDWRSAFETTLPEFGHRNWIVVADYAYPSQSAPGIQTIVTGSTHLEVLEYVLEKAGSSPHVNPIIMLDRELEFISEIDAPGVDAFRLSLGNLLKGKKVSRLPHVDIIKQLDAESELYRVLILKTNMTIPYTSVFLNLDCAYWGAEKETGLREAMEEGP